MAEPGPGPALWLRAPLLLSLSTPHPLAPPGPHIPISSYHSTFPSSPTAHSGFSSCRHSSRCLFLLRIRGLGQIGLSARALLCGAASRGLLGGHQPCTPPSSAGEAPEVGCCEHSAQCHGSEPLPTRQQYGFWFLTGNGTLGFHPSLLHCTALCPASPF